MQLQIDSESQQQQHEQDRHIGRRQAAVTRCSSSFCFLERVFVRYCSSSRSSLLGWSKEGHYLASSVVVIYERYVEDAEKLVRDVASGASLLGQPQAFGYPLVTWLLQGETLTYRGMQGRSQSRRLHISPVSTDGRGVEAQLCYRYADRKMPSKHLEVVLLLRIVESTDIVATVISCLRVLTASLGFKDVPVPDCASGEISLLSDLQDTSHSKAPPFHSGYFCIQHREFFRPDPVCCTNNIVSSRMSSLGLPEPVFSMHFSCFVSAKDYIQLHGSTTDGVVLNAPLLYLTICLFPHSTSSTDPREIMLFRSNIKGKEYSECKHVPDGSIQLMETTLRSKAANHDYLIRRPSQADYSVDWRSPHGKATMSLTAPSTEKMAYLLGRPTKKVPSSPLKAAKRKW